MFKLKGYSGCGLQLHPDEKNHYFVRKISDDKDYFLRLKKQAAKQIDFAAQDNILVPKVLKEYEKESYYAFDMEYIWGTDFLSFTHKCPKQSLDWLGDIILEFISGNLQKSNWAEFPHAKFRKKLETTLDAIKSRDRIDSNFLKETEKFFNKADYSYSFPFGYCHGDLTFSNMLVLDRGNQLAFIDFLDVEINTPLHDIVKLRQDTIHGWSLRLYEGDIDETKIKIAWKHLDRRVWDGLNSEFQLKPYYKIMQVLNFLRILKYTRSPEMDRFLCKCINNVMVKE